MKLTTPCKTILEPGVAEFLKRNAAEAEFQTTSQLIGVCFPESNDIRAFLLQDPDEDERQRVILEVTVPPSHPLERLQSQRCRFSEQLVEQLPPAKFPHPVCGLMIRFARV